MKVAVDYTHNVIVGGFSPNSTNSTNDFLTIKYDTNGNVLWTQSYDSGGNDIGTDLAVDNLANVIVTGMTGGGTRTVVKYDSSGQTQWIRTLPANGQWGASLAVDAAGNIFASGPIAITKYDANGNTLWDQNVVAWGIQVVAIATDSNGDLLATGTRSMGGSYYWATEKFAGSNGALLWAVYDPATGSPNRYAIAQGLAIDPLDNLVVVGHDANQRLRVVKYTKAGALLWTASPDPNSIDDGTSVALESGTNNLLIAGLSGGRNAMVLKTDANGVFQWRYDYMDSSNGQSEFFGIALDGQNILVAGLRIIAGSNQLVAAKLGTPVVDMQLSLSGPASAKTGDGIAYTLAVTNAGPSMATGVNVNISLPPGVSYVGAGNVQGLGPYATPNLCIAPGVRCEIGGMERGTTVTFTVYLQTSAPGTANTTANVTANESDPNTPNNTASLSTIVAPLDGTPPLITPSISPSPNAAGWNNSNVTVTWSVTDPESGISSSSGCSNFTLTAETDGSLVTCSATNGAGLTNSASVIVKIDKTPPAISAGRTAANANGWNNNPVTVTFTCSDALSGLVAGSPPAPTTISTEGANQSLNGSCQDAAGNSASARVDGINIDRTSPIAAASAAPAANANGWNNSSVVVNITGTDSLSGIDSCTGPIVLNTEGINQTASGACTDKAGNVSAAANIAGINIDKTPPTLAFAAASPAANPAGWNDSNVSIAFTPADALSGIASISSPSPLLLTTEGTAVSETVTITDKAGNNATFTSPVVKIDKTPPIVSSSRTAANAYGWNNTNVTVTFTCSDTLSGIPAGSPPAPTTISAEGANQSVNGSCQDAAGNAASATVAAINIDKTPPTASASAAPIANTYGWNNSSVVVSIAGTDSLSGIDNCSAPVTLSEEGPGQSAFGTCTDKAGNVSGPATVSGINIDKTPPTLTFGAASPPANAAGWSSSNVSIAFTPADPLSGIASSPASPLVLSAEGAAVSGTVTITDRAGNSATFTSPAVKIDKTPPSISTSRTPANGNGWNNTDVTVNFTCSDTLSGLAAGSPPAPKSVSAEGANQSITGSCQDAAGNSASTIVSGINIDKTPPTATATAAPAASPNGWNNSNVVVSIAGTDSLSGIDICTAPITLSTEGAGQSGSGTCIDKAGNVSAPATVSGINIDKTAPSITLVSRTQPNANNWNSTDVVLQWSCFDGISGAVLPSASQTLSASGANQSATATCTDKAGNSASNTQSSINIDKTPPVITGPTITGTLGSNGWYSSNVSVGWAASDLESGVAASSGCEPVTLASDTQGTTLTCAVTNQAGLSNSKSVTLKIDQSMPLAANLIVTPNPVAINTGVSLSASLTDAGGNLARAEFSINGSAPVPLTMASGTTAQVASAISPFSVTGIYNVCIHAVDLAGNVGPDQCQLLPVYDPNGGFVTGGGWINSPVGAYIANPSLTGKAVFGFVSKYQRGANAPTGDTQFQFQVANLNFKSTAYDWLVISGARAQYKGSGTINGAGNYSFLLTAIDGSMPGGGGVDRFRIKIWDANGVVYDNEFGADDNVNATTAVVGGGIVIHQD